jgi:diacylglycerol kinase (ATP)
MKNRWGKLAYLRASLEVARQYEAKEVTLTLDGVERKLRVVNLAIGNCRYAGSGSLVAPRANPEDRLLDLVAIEDVGLQGVLKLTPTVLADSVYSDKKGVFFARAQEIRVEASPGSLEFTVDGEVIGDEPAIFAAIPRALKVVVGPGYVPEPAK